MMRRSLRDKKLRYGVGREILYPGGFESLKPRLTQIHRFVYA